MIPTAKEEYQAVARGSGNVVHTFNREEDALRWRDEHPSHSVRIEHVLTITFRTEIR